jgi:hypothetical protein
MVGLDLRDDCVKEQNPSDRQALDACDLIEGLSSSPLCALAPL